MTCPTVQPRCSKKIGAGKLTPKKTYKVKLSKDAESMLVKDQVVIYDDIGDIVEKLLFGGLHLELNRRGQN